MRNCFLTLLLFPPIAFTRPISFVLSATETSMMFISPMADPIRVINPITTALLPKFTAYYSAKDNKSAKQLFTKTSLFISILVFSIMAVLSFFAKDLVWVWTGNTILAEKTHRLIPVIALAYAMFALQLLPYNIAIANGYTKCGVQ
ncbi:MAG: hypothetical protein EOO88_41355 [Pedobacter sp.]|nr:MAG: hypothetical protein EOO88_41355 [Pedobacter sp.]